MPGKNSRDGNSTPATIAVTGAQVSDVRLAEPAQFRMVLISFLAAGIGLLAGSIAFVLYKLIGLVTNIVFLRALDNDPSGAIGVLDAGTRDVIVTYPDEVLHEAAAKMLRSDIGRLPVVDRSDRQRVVGYLGRPGKHGCPTARVER